MPLWRSSSQVEMEALDPVRDHQRIVHLLACYEFPWDMTRSLELALLRTFCSPAVSRLLDQTKEFVGRPQKRYDDTDRWRFGRLSRLDTLIFQSCRIRNARAVFAHDRRIAGFDSEIPLALRTGPFLTLGHRCRSPAAVELMPLMITQTGLIRINRLRRR